MKARRKNKAKNKRGIIRSTLIIGLSAVLLYQLGLFIMVVWFNFHNPRHSAFMRATLNELRTVDSHARLKQKWVPYDQRSEEHTSELQSLMRISYAVFCLKKKKTTYKKTN